MIKRTPALTKKLMLPTTCGNWSGVTSPEFFSNTIYRAKVRSPFEYVAAAMRALNAETERLRSEQNEAGETAAKLLGEMKDLVNQVAHKFQGPSKTSPFAREPRSPQS